MILSLQILQKTKQKNKCLKVHLQSWWTLMEVEPAKLCPNIHSNFRRYTLLPRRRGRSGTSEMISSAENWTRCGTLGDAVCWHTTSWLPTQRFILFSLKKTMKKCFKKMIFRYICVCDRCRSVTDLTTNSQFKLWRKSSFKKETRVCIS